MAKKPNGGEKPKNSSPTLLVPLAEAQRDLDLLIFNGEQLLDRRELLSSSAVNETLSEAQKWEQSSAEWLRKVTSNDQFFAEFTSQADIARDWDPGFQLPEQMRWSYLKHNVRVRLDRLKAVKENLPSLKVQLPGATTQTAKRNNAGGTKKVFVVHGHDNAVKESVARLIEKLGLTATILHEQSSLLKTVIEKFEAHADVDFAVVLLTADDVGAAKEESGNLQPRARQNVVLELGYFIGTLGRDRVALVYSPGIELPSDIGGALPIEYDKAGAWKFRLASELKSAGLRVDLNKIA